MLIKELVDQLGWIDGVMTLVTGTSLAGAIKYYRSSKAAHDTEIQLLKSASLATLHSQLYEKGGRYIKFNSITLSELDDLEYTWNAYRDLGGNGTGEMIYTKCCQLPISDYAPNESWQEVEDLASKHEAERDA